MNVLPPTRNQHNSPPEGARSPSVRLRGEKASVVNHDYGATSESRRRAARSSQLQPMTFPESWWKRNVIVLLFVVLFSVPAYFLASRFIVTAVVVQGRSMTPTLRDGERYYLNRWRYLFVPPERGDLVVIKDPGHKDFAVKRVVGQPYDWLNLKDGLIYINGKRLNEPYLPRGVRTDTPDLKERWVQLGAHQYYVLGDNRANSEDSRFYGVVSREDIVGMLIK